MAPPGQATPLSRFRYWLAGKVAGKAGVSLVPGSSFGQALSPGFDFAGWTEPSGKLNLIRYIGSGNSEAERVGADTAYVAAAYAYAAMRARAALFRQAPLMVVEEDQETGNEAWLPRHPLAPLLERPTSDCGMGELLFRTSLAVDQGGQALWVIDKNGLGKPARLQLFRDSEFTLLSTPDRIRGRVRIETDRGPKELDIEDTVLFQEPNPNDWKRGVSRLEVYLGWLNLGQTARATVRDLLQNAVWPSVIIQPDAAWNPTAEEFEEYKAQADSYALPGNRGKPLTMLGGGTATVVSARIRDLLPEELLNRVESIAAAVFGVPAIVLQFQVGMENSPWSQMADARRMFYEDTGAELWKTTEELLTRQLLRPMDSSLKRFVRFDTSKLTALQPDKERLSRIAVLWDRMASLNERRALVGLEPVDDPKAEVIPELEPPPVPRPLGPESEEEEQAEEEERTAAELEDEKRRPSKTERKRRRDLFAALRRDQASRTEFAWRVLAQRELERDRAAIVQLAKTHLEGGKADGPSPIQSRRFLEASASYLKGESAERWLAQAKARVAADASNVVSTLGADVGVGFDVLRPGIRAYAEKEAAFLVKNISETTRDAIQRTLAEGLEKGWGAREIASQLQTLPEFSSTRALLVARTEATRVTNGAPTESLKLAQAETGKRFTKTWRTALDERVRDEHVALEGETVGIEEEFSNGLQFPSEPNCRCVTTFEESSG